jgi:hypothetical protein
LTLTVDLSAVDFTSLGGSSGGVLPASDTIYMRAHTKYTGSNPGPDATFNFQTTTNATLTGVGTTSNTSNRTIVANPTVPISGGTCNADGIIVP